MSTATTPSKSTSVTHWAPGGTVASVLASDGTSYNASSDAATNYAAPQTITAQSYSTSVAYNSWLGVTQTTGQNGEQLQMAYNGWGLPTSGTSPYGAVTNYTYSGATRSRSRRPGPGRTAIRRRRSTEWGGRSRFCADRVRRRFSRKWTRFTLPAPARRWPSCRRLRSPTHRADSGLDDLHL